MYHNLLTNVSQHFFPITNISVQFSSVARLCPTLRPDGLQHARLPDSRNLIKFMSIEVVMPSNHLILCRSLLLPSVFPSIKVFSSELVLCIRWPKHWSFSFIINLAKFTCCVQLQLIP